MPNNMNHRILLVGSGPMAQEYAKVLMSLGVCFDVIGRGNDSANRFKENTGISVITGGLVDAYEKLPDKPTHAIIATNVEYLAEHTLFLLSKGINNILVEKPAGLYLEEIEKVADFAKLKQAKVYVAYNRRFYSSVIETQKFIEKDGGVLSFHFEFTEWSHIVEKLNRPKEVLQQWLLANSTHVIDLAFYLGGEPKEICSFISGGTDWHPSASIFSGAGTTVNGALFSYHANWEAPGRWGVEILTKQHRLILRPLEELYIQEIGDINIKKVNIDNALDVQYKPGLYKQVEKFLMKDNSGLLDIQRHYMLCEKIYNKINMRSNK